jgi:hypothetical protein
MSAILTPTRRSLLARLADLPRRAWLEVRIFICRWNIDSTEKWLIECEADGIVDSMNLREFERELEADRVELATLEAQR